MTGNAGLSGHQVLGRSPVAQPILQFFNTQRAALQEAGAIEVHSPIEMGSSVGWGNGCCFGFERTPATRAWAFVDSWPTAGPEAALFPLALCAARAARPQGSCSVSPRYSSSETQRCVAEGGCSINRTSLLHSTRPKAARRLPSTLASCSIAGLLLLSSIPTLF